MCPEALGSCPLGGARSRKGNRRRHRQPAQHRLLHHQEVSIAAAFPTAFAAPHLYLCVCVSKIVSCRSPAAALAVLWTMMYGRVISTNLPRPQFAHTRTHGHFNLGHRFTAIKPSETFLKPLVCVLILLAQPLTDSFYSHAHDKAKFNDQLWKIGID